MSEKSPVRIDREDGQVAVIVIDRPEKRNALDLATIEALRAALHELRADPHVHAVVLTGVDKSFVAGADIAEMRERRAEDALRAINSSLFREVEDFPRPVIAAINGYALGGGCELALACDIRIAQTSAKLGQPEVGLGIIPAAGGCYRLARLVGLGRAKELIFSGRVISADEALAIGLVEEVVADGQARARAVTLAREIAKQAPLAVRVAKAALNAFARGSTPEVLLESSLQGILYETEDKQRRMTEFLEKRAKKS